MEQPATAPPMVMVLSSGTTIGTKPRGRVRSTSLQNGTPGSAMQMRRSGSISMTSSKSSRSTFSSVYFLSWTLGTW